MLYELDFQPIGRHGACPAGQTVLDSARDLGVDLLSTCGGDGICGDCVLQVIAGLTSARTELEVELLTAPELEEGFRLACQTYPRSDLKLHVPARALSGPMRTLVSGAETAVTLNPVVQAFDLLVDPPSLERASADSTRLLGALARAGGTAERIDLPLLHTLSTDLRAWDWRCRAHTAYDEVLALSPSGSASLGFAADLGSTSIAGYLLDLQSGETLASAGLMNPQISYGEDIIARLRYANRRADGRQTMQRLALQALQELISALCAEAGARPEQVVDAVVTGNTAMHHLLLGLPTAQLAAAPFAAVAGHAVSVRARDLGLAIAPGAFVAFPPILAGFVGADHVSMLLATLPLAGDGPALLLDIGTNTEISLLAPGGRLTTVSCASGPAFEGYGLRDGMRAANGAIERVLLHEGELYLDIIGDAPPAGICGSGILDAIAHLSQAGILDRDGRLRPGAHPRVIELGGQRAFILVRPEEHPDGRAVAITQADVRAIQLAKASIQTGIDILLHENGTHTQDLRTVIIAGAFGQYIDIGHSVTIGMLPPLPLDRFRQVGNAAGTGARLALLSREQRAAAEALPERVRYIELAGYPRFARRFAESCRLHPSGETVAP